MWGGEEKKGRGMIKLLFFTVSVLKSPFTNRFGSNLVWMFQMVGWLISLAKIAISEPI